MRLKKLFSWLKSHFWDIFFIAALVAISLFIAFKNYTPGTWLVGWDNLMPELNFKLNIARSFSAVWQEYQGLGLLSGMAHAADLPRQIFLWASSLFIPVTFLRYFWTFLMLAGGPLGVYLVVSRVFVTKSVGFLGKIAGLAAAIFYLFNLATLQTFYTPFEPFVSFYGFLPWLLYFALDYLKNGGKGKLIAYFLISLLATGAFYVQTLFVVYAIFLAVFALESIVRYGKDGILRSFKVGLVTLFVNAFWLLPALYFTATSAAITMSSHINSIATPETQLMNAARADFKNITSLKGYWFDYYDWGQNGAYDYLYKTWIDYSNQPIVAIISLTLFFVCVFGLVFSLLKKKTTYGLSFLVLFGISYFMLAGGSLPWIPFFSEIFRNVFTKWANAAAFIYAVGLGLFIYIVSDILGGKIKYFLGTLISLCIVGASIFSVLPILQGELIAKSMKLNTPSYYLDTINYLKTQDPTKRIVDFPLTDFWGWKFNDWGYRGSGFLWYGIPQPILDRAFDVWSPYNEAFYSEISHAVEAGNLDELSYVLEKYQVGYILFDGSIFEPGNANSASKIQKQKDFLESSPFITKVKAFGSVAVYRVNRGETDSFVSAAQSDFSSPFIVLGTKGEAEIKETFPDTQGYSETKNCDLKGQGNVIKKKLGGGNFYGAYDGGIACDYFYYPTIDYSKAYLMRLSGKNITGRSLKFYLYNVNSGVVDMQELLPPGDFDKSYVILPASKEKSVGEGYTLNVETRSFGKVKSENLVTAVEFYPADHSYVQGETLYINNLKILGVKKYGTWAYKVETDGGGLLELGQGYDNGWVALQTQNSKLKILEHVKVNSWANGWTVPTNIEARVSSIYIVFWPQLLEWGGGILGFVTLLVLIFKAQRKREQYPLT